MQFARIHAPSGAGHITVLRWGPSAMLRDTHFFPNRRFELQVPRFLSGHSILQPNPRCRLVPLDSSRDTQFYNQIVDLGKIGGGGGNWTRVRDVSMKRPTYLVSLWFSSRVTKRQVNKR